MKPYLEKLTWYKAKKPILQIKILELLATGRRLSVSMAEDILKEHHHPEIWHGFKNLESNCLIKKLKQKNYEEIKAIDRGRQKEYYKITEQGLYVLIQEARTADKFWRAIIAYSHHNYRKITFGKVKELYQSFVCKHLKYLSRSTYPLQLDLFDELCNNWFQDIIKNSQKITPDQMFLEVLAMHPAITFEEIARYTGKPVREDKIKGILSRYTETYHEINDIDDDRNSEETSSNHKDDNFDDKFHRLVITTCNNDTSTTYELSLFGVMLVLALVRYNDMGTLKGGLYFNGFSPSAHYDIIASNYSNKLPLIFGKQWKLLKKTLKGIAIYNFDIIFSEEVRSESFDEPYLVNGNRELYQSTMKIALYRRKQLEEFQSEALKQYDNYIREITADLPAEAVEDVRDKVHPVFQIAFSISPYHHIAKIDTCLVLTLIC